MTKYVLALITILVGCGGSAPQVRYYQLASPAAGARGPGGAVLAVEPLAAEGAYDDDRIVYRVDPVRLDYYDYHHWSATPGAMVGAYLEQAFAGTGKFRSVVRATTTETAAVLGGRVIAIEEIDESKTRWVGHIAVELTLTDPKSGATVWSHAYDEREPLAAQTQEGLARAIGAAMDRIVRAATPEIADLAERQARARGLIAPTVAGE